MKTLKARQLETVLSHAGAVYELIKYRNYAKRFAKALTTETLINQPYRCLICRRFGDKHWPHCIVPVAVRFLQHEKKGLR